ncbi:hypothetical protein P9112_003429 [Eukaryota sp. TZLM1-RC]
MPSHRGIPNASIKPTLRSKEVRKEGNSGLKQMVSYGGDWDQRMSKHLQHRKLEPGAKATHPQTEPPHYTKKSTKSMLLPWDMGGSKRTPYHSVAEPCTRTKTGNNWQIHVLGGKKRTH